MKEVIQNIDKRITNEELITRTLFPGVLLAVITAIAKYFIFDVKF